MILPSKHLLSQDSLIGIGGLIIARVGNHGATVSSVWEQLHDKREVGTYERFILALDALFMLGFIMLEEGLLVKKGPEA
jgi:hypothetical protein